MAESQNIEYKQSWRDEYLKWICGFANAQGGQIFIGIDDQGKVTGVSDYKKLMEDIPNKAVNHLGLVVDVNLHKKAGKYFIEIHVPISTVAISYHGNYHYRSGSTKQELQGAALQQFLLKKSGKTWDEMTVPKATYFKFNGNTINAFLHHATQIQRISPEAPSDDYDLLLARLHLTNDEGHLKNAAILLFYEDPLVYFTTAVFKIGRFGATDADLRFQDVIEGNIFDMPDQVMQTLRSKYLTSPISYVGLQRKEELEYPEAALREAILNAIVHKDYTGPAIQLSIYDDRLVLWNPGHLPPELTVEMLISKHPSYPRNKNIADIFFKAGYIEAWGRGIAKMIEACRAVNLPEPEIVPLAGGIQVTFYKDKFTRRYLNNLELNDRQIMSVLFTKQAGRTSNKQYQEMFRVSRETASRDLAQLVALGIFVNSGKKGAGSYFLINL